LRKAALATLANTENYRPDFSSEREPHSNKPATVYKYVIKERKGKNWSRVRDGCLTPR
jgi:hypothetical protein